MNQMHYIPGCYWKLGGSKCGVKPCFYELSSSDWQNQDLMESLKSATKLGFFET